MFKQLFIALFIFLWLAFGLWSYNLIKKKRSKYLKYKKFQPVPQKFIGLIRDDYHKWNMQKIAIGCFTLLPIRMLLFLSILPIGFIFVFLIRIFGYRTILCSGFFLYISTVGRFVNNLLCKIKQQSVSEKKRVLTPIIISNHVNWFDIFVLFFNYSPFSFVAKKQIKSWPIFSTFAQLIQSIYISRQSQAGRNQVRQLIKKRIEDVTKLKKQVYPLLIFPQGTTSNNNGLLTFKSGAFQNMSAITAFCLKYQCQNFGVGMDQIGQIQHVLLMISQLCTLTVTRVDFQPNIGQTCEQYQERCRKVMADILKIPLTSGGYRDKIQLENIRDKQIKGQ